MAMRWAFAVCGTFLSVSLATSQTPGTGAVDGGIGQWGSWGQVQCPAVCGYSPNGVQKRRRFCNNTSPSNGGRDCEGTREESKKVPCTAGRCLREYICQPLIVTDCTAPDVVYFVVDGSNSIGSANFNLLKEAMKNAIKFEIRRNDAIKLGVVVFSDNATDIVRASSNISFLNSKIDALVYPGKSSLTHLGINKARELMLEDTTGNAKVMIVITDGVSAVPDATTNSSRKAKDSGITIVAIGIAENLRSIDAVYRRYLTELGNIASSPLLVINVDTFKNLSTFADDLATPYCSTFVAEEVSKWGQWSIPDCGRVCGPPSLVGPSVRRRTCTNPLPSNSRFCNAVLEESSLKPCNLSQCIDEVQLLRNNATGTRGSTVILQVTLSQETPQGYWVHNLTNVFNTARTRYSVVGLNHRLTISGILDSDTGQYHYISIRGYTTGYLSIVAAVNGEWSQWSVWSNPNCESQICGTAEKPITRSRSCTNPSPQFGGRPCSGVSQQNSMRSCNLPPCINGNMTLLENNVTTTVGCTVSLQVIINRHVGIGTWSKESTFVPNTARTRYSLSSRVHQLTIANVQDSDAGLYYYILPSHYVQGYLIVLERADVEGLCESAEIHEGVGYRYHPEDCDKYIQCYNNANGDVLGIYRTCPFAYVWNQATYSCEKQSGVKCPLEKCKGTCGVGHKMIGSCRSFWECHMGKMKAKCCPTGYSFIPGKGCRFNINCDDLCPSPYDLRVGCNKRQTDGGNLASYESFVENLGWTSYICPAGSVFDIMECDCIVRSTASCEASHSLLFTTASPSWITVTNVNITNGVANFNDESEMYLNVKIRRRDYPVGLKIRYRESATSTERQVLASSSDCEKGNSLVVATDDEVLHFQMKSWFDDVTMMSLSTKGMQKTEWKTVIIVYDGFQLTAKVESGKISYMSRLFGQRTKGFSARSSWADIMECGLRIGDGGSSNTDRSFMGSVDRVSIYKCDPGFF